MGIGDVHANFYRTGSAVECGFDKCDPTFENISGIGLSGEGNRLAVMEPREVGFVCVEHEPDLGQVGDGVDGRTRIDVHAFPGVAFNNGAAHGCVDSNVVG